MTPELVALIGGLLDRYGLPISLLIGLGWLLLTRRLVLGSELNYVEARRQEERDGRLAAEATIRDLAPKQALVIETLTDTMAGGFDHLGDLIEGRTPRARR